MRILFISNLYPPYFRGGNELVLERVRGELMTRGDACAVLTSRYRLDDGEVHGDRDVYRLLTYAPYDGASPPPPLREQWRFQRRERSVLDDVIASYEPDVISVWNMGGLASGLVGYLLRAPRPVVFRFGDAWPEVVMRRDRWIRAWRADPPQTHRRFVKSLLRSWLRRHHFLPPDGGWTFDKYIVNSRGTMNALEYGGVRMGERRACIPSGIDVDAFAHRTRKFGEGGEFPVLVVGRICPDKGQETVVRAVTELHRDQVPVRLTLVGPDDDREYAARLRAWVRAEHLEAVITMTGPAAAADMPALYAAHDILVYPSIWEEPFGNSIVEAWAAGCVVVGTGTGGAADLLSDGETGYLYPPGDVDACARVVREIIDGSRDITAPIRNGRDRARREFALEAAVTAMRKFFDDVRDGAPTP